MKFRPVRSRAREREHVCLSVCVRDSSCSRPSSAIQIKDGNNCDLENWCVRTGKTGVNVCLQHYILHTCTRLSPKRSDLINDSAQQRRFRCCVCVFWPHHSHAHICLHAWCQFVFHTEIFSLCTYQNDAATAARSRWFEHMNWFVFVSHESAEAHQAVDSFPHIWILSSYPARTLKFKLSTLHGLNRA